MHDLFTTLFVTNLSTATLEILHLCNLFNANAIYFKFV